MFERLSKYRLVKKVFPWGAGLATAFVLGITLFANDPVLAQGFPKDIDPDLAKKILESGATPDQINKLLKNRPGADGGRVRRSPLDRARENEQFPGDQVRQSPLDQAREGGGFSGLSSSRRRQQLDLEAQGPLSQIERSFIRRIWGRDAERRALDPSYIAPTEKPDDPAEIRTIRQFGYENFRMAKEPAEEFGFPRQEKKEIPLTGAISDSYILGIGDDIVVTYQGREEDAFSVRIDREGRLVLPKLPPIPAAGRTFGALVADVEARVASTLVGTQVFLSLGTVRVISVYVVGEVGNPGLYRLTSLSTIADALVQAGGVLKTGSLRQIEITRGDRRLLLDTYDLMLSGGPNYDLSLMDGDRIFVPTLSSVVAASGDVMRPAIYELPYGRHEISVAELLHLSGGPIVRRGNRIVLVSVDAAGRAITSEPQDLAAAVIRGGEYIRVISAQGLEGGVVTVQGQVNNPGTRSLVRTPTIGALLGGPELFKINPYLNFATIRRTDPVSLTTSLIPVNLHPILAGSVDIELQNRDVLSVFSVEDIRYLISPEVQAVIRGRADDLALKVEGSNECAGLGALEAIMDGARADRFVRAKYFSRHFGEIKGTATIQKRETECPRIFNENPELLAYLLEHSVVLSGEVRRPGIFPVTQGASLSGVLGAAGGISVDADLKQLEVSRAGRGGGQAIDRRTYDLTKPETARLAIGPGDTVRVNSKVSGLDQGPVIIEGEVRRPGIYNIRRGERLSEIIARAGGLTEQGFSKGAVFTREAARQEEKKAFGRVADQLQMSLASNLLVVGGNGGANVGDVSLAAQKIVTQLREATPVGRVVIEADPTVLAVDPSLDTILEPNDRLFVPKRPNWVSVTGAILNPGTVQFTPGSNPSDYIKMVGGFTDAADKGRVYVVYPDGRALPVKTSFWNFQSVQLIPGSSIVVPMDATPFRFLPIAREVTAALSQLSIAAASLAVINRR